MKANNPSSDISGHIGCTRGRPSGRIVARNARPTPCWYSSDFPCAAISGSCCLKASHDTTSTDCPFRAGRARPLSRTERHHPSSQPEHRTGDLCRAARAHMRRSGANPLLHPAVHQCSPSSCTDRQLWAGAFKISMNVRPSSRSALEEAQSECARPVRLDARLARVRDCDGRPAILDRARGRRRRCVRVPAGLRGRPTPPRALRRRLAVLQPAGPRPRARSVVHRAVMAPSAVHPPLFSLYLGMVSRLGADSALAHRIGACVAGAAAVGVIGLVGRRLAGDRAGLIAAVIAALYPYFWINDAVGLSESLLALTTALVLLAAYAFWRRPTPWRAVAFGAAIALVALTRAAAGVLFAILALPWVVVGPGLAGARRP